MSPSVAAVLALALSWGVPCVRGQAPSAPDASSSPSADLSALKKAFLDGSPIPDELRPLGEAYSQAVAVQAGPRDGEDAEAFGARVRSVGGRLGLSDEDSARAERLYGARRGGPASKDAPDAVGVDAAVPAAGGDSGSGGVLTRAKAIAAGLGISRADDLSGPEGGPRPAASAADAAAVSRALNAQAAGGKGLASRGVPEPGDVLHAMGSLDVAPAPTIAMRARALFSSQPQTVAQDLGTVRAVAGSLQLPADGHTGLASSQADLDAFVAWVKTVKDSDLPKIGYGVLKPGEIGRYERGVFSKSSITLNLSVQDAEPQARAAVLFHELYHYWDNEVARNHYGNVSYGFIDPSHLPEHEYDAYYLTAVLWRQAKPDGAASPLAQFLDKLPTDRGQVPALVDQNLTVIPK